VAERLHGRLKAPVKRLGSPRAPIAYAPPLEDAVRVSHERIIETAAGADARLERENQGGTHESVARQFGARPRGRARRRRPGRAQTYKAEYKVSTVVGAPFPWGLSAERWGEPRPRAHQRAHQPEGLSGRALVGGDQTKEFTAMRQGVIDMAVGSTINWSPQVVELNLFSLPFLMPDHKAIDAITTGEAGKKLFELIASKDVVPLAWGENGYRELSNSKRDVRKPEDLKGLKIRVVGSPLFNETFTALGANPTQMSWADAQPALSTGAVDGQENPMTIFTVAKLHTVGRST
jgi:hypothetical protein